MCKMHLTIYISANASNQHDFHSIRISFSHLYMKIYFLFEFLDFPDLNIFDYAQITIGLGSRHCLYRPIKLWIDGGDRLTYSAVWSMLCGKVEACPVCSAFWSSVYEKYNLTKFFTRPL